MFTLSPRKSLEQKESYSNECYNQAKSYIDRQNYEQAVLYLEMSIKNYNHGEALFKLGEMNMKGLGCEQDHYKAFELLEKSVKFSKKIKSQAEYFMGLMCEKGWGVRKDSERAIMMYSLASHDGHELANKRLSAIQQLSPASTLPPNEDSKETDSFASISPKNSPKPESAIEQKNSGCCNGCIII